MLPLTLDVQNVPTLQCHPYVSCFTQLLNNNLMEFSCLPQICLKITQFVSQNCIHVHILLKMYPLNLNLHIVYYNFIKIY